ncbi:hypothetical protein ACFSJY_15040 [Thalassotalea euphylliae]|uniref:hypothetical protein n=1 Tax=Thalassotalea euphylliae TaxID=1655234 RepID=UPI00362EC034
MIKILSIAVIAFTTFSAPANAAKNQQPAGVITENIECATAKSCMLQCRESSARNWDNISSANDGMSVKHFPNGTTKYYFNNHAKSNSSVYVNKNTLICRIINQK